MDFVPFFLVVFQQNRESVFVNLFVCPFHKIKIMVSTSICQRLIFVLYIFWGSSDPHKKGDFWGYFDFKV